MYNCIHCPAPLYILLHIYCTRGIRRTECAAKWRVCARVLFGRSTICNAVLQSQLGCAASWVVIGTGDLRYFNRPE